jgi:hypothetical protein
LVETAVKTALAAANAPVRALEARALKGDATVEATKILAPLSLAEVSKARIIDAVTREGAIPMKDGAIDGDKFRELVIAEAKREGSYVASITGNRGEVFGLGASTPNPDDQVKTKEQRKEEKRARKALRESTVDVFTQLMGGNAKAAELAAGKAA